MQVEEGPSFSEAMRAWMHVGLFSFGGPAAQIALMHKVVVEEKNWLAERQFLNALNFCMLLPGPEAMQLATYVGWRLHGTLGGLVAGLLFVAPGAMVVLALSVLFVSYGDISFVAAMFFGIKAAVLVIVLEALLRVAGKALKSKRHIAIAAFAFIGLFFFSVPYPLIILIAATIGFLQSKPVDGEQQTTRVTIGIGLAGTLKISVVWLCLWAVPFVVLLASGSHDILTDLAAFFSKLAVVTFGGAYAVLAYMAQDAVAHNGWLSAEEMITGLGLAETTPGPLILVTEFVGFIAAYKEGGLITGILGALITLWVTFVPCFLWIFAGAPYIEWISSQPRLRGALVAITAAVVGVILNLSIWFAMHVLFKDAEMRSVGLLNWLSPNYASLDWLSLLLAVLSGLLLLVLKWNLILVLAITALGGIIFSAF